MMKEKVQSPGRFNVLHSVASLNAKNIVEARTTNLAHIGFIAWAFIAATYFVLRII